MKFSLTIRMDSDAFDGVGDGPSWDGLQEVARILRDEVSNSLRCGEGFGTLHDVNGNTVGGFGITNEES